MATAIVGCGGIGRAHAAAYAEAGFPPTAFVDEVFEAAQRLADTYGGTALRSVTDLPSNVNLVSVTTPPHTHFEICRTLLESGRHVWCEKPLGSTSQEAKELVLLAEAMDRVLLVGFKYHYESVFAAARAEVPKVGRVLAATCIKTQGYPRKPVDWVASTGVLYELSIHDLDLLDWYLRKPEDGDESPIVLSAELVHRFGHEAEDQAYVTVRYPNGVVAQVAGVYSDQTKFLGHDVALSIAGDLGFMRVERPDRIVLQVGDQFTEWRVDPDPVNPFTREALNLIATIAGDEELRVAPMSGVHANAVIEQAHLLGSRTK